MEPKLMTYIWRYSSRQQISLIILTVLSFPILYLSLELPKMIVNDAIIAHEEQKTVAGYDFGAMEYVLLLSFIFLCLQLGNGWFKMRINTFRGVVGERMLRRLRLSLIDRALRFPLPHYSKVSAGEVISTVTAETEPLAGFIGDSYALPAFQGGTMITILAFMFIQDPLLGLASISMIPLQVYIIPKLQKRVNALKKERVRKVRKLSERLNESIVAAQEIRLQGTHRYHLAEFSMHLGGIFWTRLQLFEAKFFMKFVNNLLNQLTPILFFSLGGILVIQGNIDVGILTAALTAYKDMTAPWKELLNYYQTFQDSLIKYEQIREGFEPDGLVDYDHIANDDSLPQQLDGKVVLRDLTVSNANGDRILNRLSFTANKGDLLVIDSRDSGAMKNLAFAMRGLNGFDSGRIQYGDLPLSRVPHVTLGRRVALAGPEPVMFAGSVMQNMHYGMRHAPRPDDADSLDEQRKKEIDEAAMSGNLSDRMDEIWTDFTQAGVADFPGMRDWFSECTAVVGADKILFRNGLTQIFDLTDRPDHFANSFIRSRHILPAMLEEAGLSPLVQRFDDHRYNPALSVMENILFGLADPAVLNPANLSVDRPFLRRLVDYDIWHDAASAGMALARQVHALLGGIEADDPMLDQFSAFDKATIEAAIALRDRIDATDGIMQLHPEDEALILQLFLAIIPDKHGEDLIDDALADRIIALRQALINEPLACIEGQVTRFDEDAYHNQLSILENLVFGRLVDMPSVKMDALVNIVEQALIKEDGREFVMVMFGFGEVGIGGARLPVIAKQRLQILRAIMKRPDVLILHEPLSVMTPEERVNVIQKIHALLPDMTMIWMDQNIPETLDCDQRYSLVDGSLAGAGDHSDADEIETSRGESALRDLVTVLDENALYGPLPAAKRRLLAASGEIMELKAGEWLYRKSSDALNVFLVLDGFLDVGNETDDEAFNRYMQMRPGDTVGVYEIVSGTPRFSSIKASDDTATTRLFRIDGNIFMDMMEEDSSLALRVINLIGKRLAGE